MCPLLTNFLNGGMVYKLMVYEPMVYEPTGMIYSTNRSHKNKRPDIRETIPDIRAT